GQIYLEPNLFNSGVRPAINVGISVSRVGSAAQIKAMKKVAGSLRLDLAQYRALEAFTKFGSDLDKATLQQLTRGARLVEILKQGQYTPYPVEKQVAIIFAGTNGYLDEIPVPHIARYEKEFLEMMEMKHKDILDSIAASGEMNDENTSKMKQILEDFTNNFKVSVK
ncbi:MAG TPA: F0F1 ATP synthase subunit alpha, partial [Ignavibacteria bacterium]|nr:F0F1 ATP synthase subunit alpha [Ignavibacteria bacterium]